MQIESRGDCRTTLCKRVNDVKFKGMAIFFMGTMDNDEDAMSKLPHVELWTKYRVEWRSEADEPLSASEIVVAVSPASSSMTIDGLNNAQFTISTNTFQLPIRVSRYKAVEARIGIEFGPAVIRLRVIFVVSSKN